VADNCRKIKLNKDLIKTKWFILIIKI
jgi:hypothetical protein